MYSKMTRHDRVPNTPEKSDEIERYAREHGFAGKADFYRKSAEYGMKKNLRIDLKSGKAIAKI